MKALINQTNNQSTNQTNQAIQPTIEQSRPIDQGIENNGSARLVTLAEAKTNQEAID